MTTASRTLDWADRYGLVLMAALAAHAIVGKGFAYLGVPPLYVTELVLAAGLVAMFHTRCVVTSLLSAPAILLVATMLLAVARTIPFIPVYGVDAGRDSVLVLYASFAFVVYSLLLQRPERVADVVAFLRWFTGIYVFAGPAIYLFDLIVLPLLPEAVMSLPIPMIRAGEFGVHLSGCALLALTGLRPVRPAWLVALIMGILIVAAQNRGGMLAAVVPVMVALPFTKVWPRVVAMGMVVVLLLGLAYAADLEMPSTNPAAMHMAGERRLGARQAVDNVLSLIVPTEDAQLDDTKMFREMWWRKILTYTFGGEYFWTGKGFGVNLAVDDGFVVGDRNGPPLRSPHNSHMNVLARTGVPGVALWLSFMITWFGTMMMWAARAWQRGETVWANLMLFTACYWLSNVINASFDVALEGPMLATWFWCQTGFGLGVVSIYRASVAIPQARRSVYGREAAPVSSA